MRKIRVTKPYFNGLFVEREEDGSIIATTPNPNDLKFAIKQGKDFVKNHPKERVFITKTIRVIEIPRKERKKLKKVI